MIWKIYTWVCGFWLAFLACVMASAIVIKAVDFAIQQPLAFLGIATALILTLCSIARLIVWFDDPGCQ